MAVTADERSRRMVERISEQSLPRDLDPLVDQYRAATADRDELLWKWLWHVFPRFRLSSVPDRHADDARRAKFYLSLYMTVLDDVSERHTDRATFQVGRTLPFEETATAADDAVDAATIDLLRSAHERLDACLADAPRGDRFRELFEFDLRESLNTMDYNRLVNQGPQLANASGIDRYDTHNMLLYLYVDVDLAFSPGFDAADLATLRELTWDAQTLVRIGNWVSTWERELREDDYTSKVVVRAIEEGVVSCAELRSDAVADDELIRRIKDTAIEHDLLCRWNRLYRELRGTDHDLATVDVDGFLDGLRYLLEVDVKLRGHK
jgi:hypothetical protein